MNIHQLKNHARRVAALYASGHRSAALRADMDADKLIQQQPDTTEARRIYLSEYTAAARASACIEVAS